jgi:YD repeat-containing protein
MDDMPRPRPPHLQRHVTRHGRAVWYVRIGRGRRIRIRAPIGSPGFDAEYQGAVQELQAGKPAQQDGRRPIGSLAWLVERYRETGAWTSLSLATRRQRENIVKHVLESAGNQPVSKITKPHIVAGRDRRAKDAPFQARHFVDTMRGLFRWAVEAGFVRVDPTASVSDPTLPASAGFPVWTEADVAAYQKRWPIGTRQRVWLDVLLYTGLRRGDAVRLGRQHIRDGVGTIKTEKTDTEVTLPILPVLAKTLAAGPCGDLAFIANANGQPFTKESFGNAFSEACREAGINKSAHGIRKLAATRAANAGATESQLKAIFGWSNSKMPTLYTKAADNRRLSQQAMHMLDQQNKQNNQQTSMPSPMGGGVGAGAKSKTKPAT